MLRVNKQSYRKPFNSEDFYDEIEKSVSAGNCFETTKSLLESKLECTLGDYDILILEERYVDFLTNNLLEKVPEKIVKSIHLNDILDFINKLNTVTHLGDCCDFFSEYCSINDEKNQLVSLKHLCESSTKVRSNERYYLNEFKRACFTLVHTKTDYVSGELCFNKCLTELLKSSKDPDKLCQSLGLLPNIIHDFENDLCFKEYLKKISTDFNCDYKLQKVAKQIVGQDNFVLNKDVKKIIDSYLKKAVLKEAKVDGRVILEVHGNHIVISKVLNEVENKLRISDQIEEVRFVNADVVHVDENLSSSIWHGKNIVLLADTLIVSEDEFVIWDVSGKHATEPAEKPMVGFGKNGFGLPGADGLNGESGGNVLVMVDVIINAHNFTIVSNGGNGSKGQNGGCGMDGKDGYNLDGKSFKELFPPVSKFRDSKKNDNLETTKKNCLQCFQSIEQFYFGHSFLSMPITKNDFESYLSKCIENIDKNQSVFFKLITDSGSKIKFSFYYGPVTDACQSFLLMKGPPGENGKPGGAGGQSGMGGLAGVIDVCVNQALPFNISEIRDNGRTGKLGKTGAAGIPGKNGVDRGYADYSRDFRKNWPKYYIPGEEDDVHLKINYSRIQTSENVWSPHKDCYAEIVSKKNEIKIITKNLYNESANENCFKRDEVHIQRKKAISKESIRTQYEKEMNITGLFRLNNVLDHVKNIVVDLLGEETLQTEHKTTELKVIRPVNFFVDQIQIFNPENDLSSERFREEEKAKNTTDISVIDLVKYINTDPSNLQNWMKLLQVRVNFSQMQDIWHVLRSLPLDNCIDIQIKKIAFCNKYQLAVLENLAHTFESSQNTHCRSVYSVKHLDSALQYINKLKCINNTQEEPLSDLEEYFLKDSPQKREEVLNKLKSHLNSLKNNRKALNELLMVFWLECSSCPVTMNKLGEINKFERDKNKTLKIMLDAFQSALMRSNNKKVYNVLIKSIVEPNNQTKVAFENEIMKDEYLFTLYESYIKVVKTLFCWENLFKGDSLNGEFLSVMFNTITKKGPFSSFYREFLARTSKINIGIYGLNKRNKPVLVQNHNSIAKTSIHFLIKNNEFIQFKMSKDMIELIYSQIDKGTFFSNILNHIDSFIEKDQFDEFISKRPYLSELYKGVENSLRIHIKLTHVIMEEDNIREVMNAYHKDEERKLVNCRLEKLKYEYTGCESILHYLALHFENEGAHISANELCFILNFILKCALEKPHTVPLVSWIVAAYPQEQWIAEAVLLKIEFIHNTTLNPSLKLKCKKYLCEQNNRHMLMLLMEKISEKNTNISIERFEEIFYILSNIPQAHVGLDKLDLNDWKYYLKDKFWSHQLKQLYDWPENQLKCVSHYLVDLENMVDTNKCTNLINILKRHKSELVSSSARLVILNVFRDFTSKEIFLNDSILHELDDTDLCHWQDIIDRACFSVEEDRSLTTLIELMHSGNMPDNISTDNSILNKLNDIAEAIEQSDKMKKSLEQPDNPHYEEWITKIKENNGSNKEYFIFDVIKKYVSFAFTDKTFEDLGKQFLNYFFISSTPKSLMSNCNDDKTITFNMIFAVVVRAVELKFSIKIRAAQKLAIMIMLKSDKNVGLLSQISTGEGKSLIIVIVSIIKALHGQKIDVITSSHVLAQRDANEYKSVYNLFGVNVGHNCSENLENRIEVYSNNLVVYGELANFQRDHLLQHIYDKNILGDRSYQTIIVDEVDSMLLDKGNSTLYLSHEIPGLDKLEPVFIYIWISLNIHIDQSEVEVNVSELKNKILNEIFGLITKEDISNLDKRLNAKEIDDIFYKLIVEKIITSNGKIINEDFQIEKFPECSLKKGHLKYLFTKISKREKQFNVPNYLKNFVEMHLENWIKSGIRAISLEPGVDYVVDVDRSKMSCDRSPNITIIDRDTGSDLANSQWEEGLHQFLQLKHGCKLSLISLKAVFISNVSYFKMYKTLLGLTGTLGSNKERELIKEIYKVDFIVIPTSKPKMFEEEEPIMCSTTNEWINTIYEQVIKKTKEGRSVLVVCESVNNVVTLRQKFNQDTRSKEGCFKNILTYTRDYENWIVSKSLEPSHVIISTNLAGRGTDLKLDDKLINTGGLHVCLTFLPKNSRIEEQAFGRAARRGEPGSAQLIFTTCSHKSTSVIDQKKQRDINESLRIRDIKDYYNDHIKPEEECFKTFLDVYKSIKSSKDHDKKIKPILLQICLDHWAFWLEENTNWGFESDSFTYFFDNLKKLCSKNYASYVKSPSQLVKLGLALIDLKEYKQSISLFDRVIKEEPHFSEIARYYRLCSQVAIGQIAKEDLLKELNLVAAQIKERIKTLLMSAHTIDYLKLNNSTNILQIESFKEQQLNNCKTYELFLEYIYNITGQGFVYKDLVCPSIIDEESASRLYIDLIKKNIISGPKLKENLTEEDLIFVAEYGLLPEELSCKLKDFKGKELDEKQLVKKLKESNCVPSRELFWKELLSKNLLINEEKYSIVDLHRLELVAPSLSSVVKSIKVTNKLEDENEIWLYLPKEIDCPKENLVLVEKENLILEIGDNVYKLLKSKSIIHRNKLARLLPLHDNINFDHFDCLSKNDFLKVNISDDVVNDIISELKEKLVIQEMSNDKYSLVMNGRLVETIKLSNFCSYTDDIIKLLRTCFAFRIALQTLHLMQIKNDDPLCLPLQIRLQKCILEDLYEHEILLKSVVNAGKENSISKILQELYPEAMTVKQYEDLFKNLYSDYYISDDYEEDVNGGHMNYCVTHYITEELIQEKWLIERNNPVENETIRTLNLPLKKYYVFKERDLPTLSLDHESHSETTQIILQRHLDLSKSDRQLYVNQFITQHASSVHNVDTPSLLFHNLHKILEQRNIRFRDCTLFSVNGFDRMLVLSEMKYSTKMMFSTFGVTMLSIAQIAVGVIIRSPHILKEGVGDLIYCMTCLFSGHFNLKEYCLRKLTNLMLFAWKMLNNGGKLISNFGQKVVGSLQSATKDVIIGNTMGEIVKYSSVACITGIGYAAIDNILQPVFNNLGETLVECCLTDIDNIVDNHPVCESIKDMYLTLGRVQATKIIENSYFTLANNYTNVRNRDWAMLFGKLRSIIDKDTIAHFQELKKIRSMSAMVFINMIVKISTIIKDVIEVIKVSNMYITELSSKPSEMTDALQQTLQKSLNTTSIRLDPSSSRKEDEYDEQFLVTALNAWKKEIKSIYITNINACIISPLIGFFKNKSVAHLSKMTSKNLSMFPITFMDSSSASNMNCEQTLAINDIKQKEKSEVHNTFIYTEYDECLTELFMVKQRAEILLEIIRNNAAVDISFFELCCTVIPLALRNHGLSLPTLNVVVDNDGSHKTYSGSIGEGTDDELLLIIASNEIFPTNLEKNKMLLGSIFHALYKSISQCYPGFEVENGQYIRNLVANEIEQDLKIQQFVNSHYFMDTDNNKESNNLSSESYPITPKNTYGSQIGAKVENVFTTDRKNLRTDMEVLSFKTFQVMEGFKSALKKINNHLSLSEPHFKSFKLALEDFEQSSLVIVPSKQLSESYFDFCYATKYELIVPLKEEKIISKQKNVLVDYKVTMNLNGRDKTQCHPPFGPHILYEINPVNMFQKGSMDKSLKGYVTIDVDCGESFYSIKDCHSAGELVLPNSGHY